MRQKQAITVHTISHTHWDREWYLPFQQYRTRLVQLMDHLLDSLPKNKDYRTFHLDAQTVVLEDYLEVCPERRAEIEALVRKGRLLIGPWYILPDEFLVSGEATIRNLMLGHRLAEQFGRVMKAGYVPDPFGHISQMPQILRGFGLDNFIFMRGYAGATGRKTSEFIWESPDGSRVFAYYLPGGYGNGAWLNLFADNPQKCAQIVRDMLKKTTPWSTIPHVLLMNGTDHLMPEFEITNILRRLHGAFPGYRFIHTTMENFIRLANRRSGRRPLVRGELRQNGEFAPLLYGVLSARNYLKQRNHAVQNLLEKWAEPASAAAWLAGVSYPRKLLWQAWKYLLQNHPHDSICGCSVDPVHEQMMTRFAWAEDLGEYLVGRALTHIAALLPLKGTPDVVRSVVVFNPLARRRSGCAEIAVDLPAGFKGEFHLVDHKGKVVPAVPLSAAAENKTHVHDRLYPYWEPVRRQRVLIDAAGVPAFGYAAFQARNGKAPKHAAPAGKLSCGKNYVENKHLRLQLAADGTFQVFDKKTIRRWSGLNAFENMADVGDEYNYAPPEKDSAVNSDKIPHAWEPVRMEPLMAGFKIRTELPLPRAIDAERKGRSTETVNCLLETVATLDAVSRRVDFTTRFINNAQDHNLRVLFPSGARKASFSEALGAFDVVRRPIAAGKRGPNSVEDPPSRHPMDGFVDVADKNGGLLVCGAGLHEYEVKDDGERTIAVTLLRAVGWLSRPDIKTRNNDAGPSLPAPGAQCPGEHVFRYCLVPHDGDWEDCQGWREVMDFLHPVRCLTLPITAPAFEGNRSVIPSQNQSLPESASLLSIEPAAMILSAVKKAEDRDCLIVRAWNIGAKTVAARFVFARKVRQAYRINLAEKRLKRLALQTKNVVAIPCKPKQIVSIEIHL
ncbi:MAG: glycoside hydrolase family 38 C-terminal domain-containing protein [Kiritimatiellae bacterium]|nr:glycoside hydrolase family 38 C-terminal domain-containing protein [Kiritimatiellia bacterium]